MFVYSIAETVSKSTAAARISSVSHPSYDKAGDGWRKKERGLCTCLRSFFALCLYRHPNQINQPHKRTLSEFCLNTHTQTCVPASRISHGHGGSDRNKRESCGLFVSLSRSEANRSPQMHAKRQFETQCLSTPRIYSNQVFHQTKKWRECVKSVGRVRAAEARLCRVAPPKSYILQLGDFSKRSSFPKKPAFGHKKVIRILLKTDTAEPH